MSGTQTIYLPSHDPSKPWHKPLHAFKDMLGPIKHDLSGKMRLGYELRDGGNYGIYLRALEGETVSAYETDTFVGLSNKSSSQISRRSAEFINKLIKQSRLELYYGCAGGHWTAIVSNKPVKCNRCRIRFPDFLFRPE